MDLVASSGFGFQEPAGFTGTPLRPPGSGFYGENSFQSNIPFLTPNSMDKGFDQDFLSKVEQTIDEEKEYWSNADPFLKDELNYFLDQKTDGKKINSEYDPRKSKPKQSSIKPSYLATEKPARAEQNSYNYDYRDDKEYAYYDTEDYIRQNPTYNENEDVKNYYYDGNYYYDYDDYYDYYKDYYEQTPPTTKPPIKNKVPDFKDVLKNTNIKVQKPPLRIPFTGIKKPIKNQKPSKFPPVPKFNEISQNVKKKVTATAIDSSKTPNFENIVNAVKEKKLEVAKLAPNFADVFKYPIYQKEDEYETDYENTPNKNLDSNVNYYTEALTTRIKKFMLKVKHDSKVGEFLDILLSNDAKLSDISKQTINFDEILRKMNLDPASYANKSKFEDVFEEVKEYDQDLKNYKGPTFQQIFYATKNKGKSSKVPNFSDVLKKVNIRREDGKPDIEVGPFTSLMNFIQDNFSKTPSSIDELYEREKAPSKKKTPSKKKKRPKKTLRRRPIKKLRKSEKGGMRNVIKNVVKNMYNGARRIMLGLKYRAVKADQLLRRDAVNLRKGITGGMSKMGNKAYKNTQTNTQMAVNSMNSGLAGAVDGLKDTAQNAINGVWGSVGDTSLSRKDFVIELTTWVRRAVWFLGFTALASANPALIAVTILLALVFEVVFRVTNARKYIDSAYEKDSHSNVNDYATSLLPSFMTDFATYEHNLAADIPHPNLQTYFQDPQEAAYPNFDTFKIKRKIDGEKIRPIPLSEASSNGTNRGIWRGRRRRLRRKFRPEIYLSDRIEEQS